MYYILIYNVDFILGLSSIFTKYFENPIRIRVVEAFIKVIKKCKRNLFSCAFLKQLPSKNIKAIVYNLVKIIHSIPIHQ